MFSNVSKLRRYRCERFWGLQFFCQATKSFVPSQLSFVGSSYFANMTWRFSLHENFRVLLVRTRLQKRKIGNYKKNYAIVLQTPDSIFCRKAEPKKGTIKISPNKTLQSFINVLHHQRYMFLLQLQLYVLTIIRVTLRRIHKPLGESPHFVSLNIPFSVKGTKKVNDNFREKYLFGRRFEI